MMENGYIPTFLRSGNGMRPSIDSCCGGMAEQFKDFYITIPHNLTLVFFVDVNRTVPR